MRMFKRSFVIQTARTDNKSGRTFRRTVGELVEYEEGGDVRYRLHLYMYPYTDFQVRPKEESDTEDGKSE